MTNDERCQLKRRLETVSDQLLMAMYNLLTGDVDAVDMFGTRIIIQKKEDE